MSQRESGTSLQKLRETAKCMICLHFFKRPKKLPRCPHVLCLQCLQRQMQLNSKHNFAPCPMCRKPITLSRLEADRADPALEIQEIVDFVKQFEKCDLCELETNPNMKCEECSALICDSCLKGHIKLKPTHTLVSIIPSTDRPEPSWLRTKYCKEHDDKPLDSFCVDCGRFLCEVCFYYSHANCKANRSKGTVLNITGVYLEFLEAKIQFRRGPSSRVLLVQDLMRVARQWMNEIHNELLSCIKYFTQIKAKLTEINDNETNQNLLQRRLGRFLIELDRILTTGEDIKLKVETLRSEKTPDTEVIENILSIEEELLSFFKYRRSHTNHTNQLYMIDGIPGSNIKLISKCDLAEYEADVICILPFSCYMTKRQKLMLAETKSSLELPVSTSLRTVTTTKENESKTYEIDESVFSVLSIIMVGKKHKTVMCERSTKGRYKYYTTATSAKCIENLQHKFLKKYVSFIASSSCHLTVKEVDIGFIPDRACVTLKESEPGIYIELQMTAFRLRTSFVNLVIPPCYLKDGLLLERSFPEKDAGIIYFAGNIAQGDGLESVFYYLDSSGNCLYGASISANIVKFSCIEPYLREESFHIQIIREKSDAFSVLEHTQCSRNFCRPLLVHYHSKPTSESNKEFIVETRETDGSSRNCDVPFTSFKTSFVCSLLKGIYFVAHSDNQDLVIGQFIFDALQIRTETIKTVCQADTDMSLSKLKPFTMVGKSKKDIIVVCSVEDDNSKIVMILSEKMGKEAVEVMEIDYARSVVSGCEPSESASEDTLEGMECEVDSPSSSPSSSSASSEYPDVMMTENSERKVQHIKREIQNKERETHDGATDALDQAKIDENKLLEIKESSVVDLEMDQYGNIVYLLESKDRRKTYCINTTYIMP